MLELLTEQAAPNGLHAPSPQEGVSGVEANGSAPPATSYAIRCEFDAWRALTPREQRRILDRVAAAVSEEIERMKASDAILSRLRARA